MHTTITPALTDIFLKNLESNSLKHKIELTSAFRSQTVPSGQTPSIGSQCDCDESLLNPCRQLQ